MREEGGSEKEWGREKGERGSREKEREGVGGKERERERERGEREREREIGSTEYPSA